jgi:hypothetical protein
MSGKECHHYRGPSSTLETLYVSPCGDVPEMWATRCKVCGRTTPATLTQVESMKMARLGWWAANERKCRVLRCTVVRQECDDWQRFEMECGNEFMWQVQDAPVWCPYCGGKVAE